MSQKSDFANHPAILGGHRPLYGYHIDAAWETTSRKNLSLKSISWVAPDEDMAGQVDLVSTLMLEDRDRDYWLVSVSNSAGDSFQSTPRAEITYADIFDDRNQALELADILDVFEMETQRAIHYTMPNNGWVAYQNGCQSRMLDLSHLDGIFDRLDGVFLMQIGKDQVKRWAFGHSNLVN